MLPFTIYIGQDRIPRLGESRLFLIWDEDSCVYVYSSAESATAAIEALDVEVTKAAFDEEARPYRVEWIKPNKYRKVFGIIPQAINGEYRYVIAGEGDEPALVEMLREAHAIVGGEHMPNPSVDEFVQRLTRLYKK